MNKISWIVREVLCSNSTYTLHYMGGEVVYRINTLVTVLLKHNCFNCTPEEYVGMWRKYFVLFEVLEAIGGFERLTFEFGQDGWILMYVTGTILMLDVWCCCGMGVFYISDGVICVALLTGIVVIILAALNDIKENGLLDRNKVEKSLRLVYQHS